MLLTVVAIALIFWLLIIRPAQRRQKEVARVQGSVAPGEQVMLTSGIFGTVREMDDATLLVEVSTGVNIKVARGAVASVVHDEPEESLADEADQLGQADQADQADQVSGRSDVPGRADGTERTDGEER